MEFIVGILILVVAMIFAVFLRRSLAEKRAKKVHKFATDISYSYSQNGEKILQHLESLPIYTKGYSRNVSNIISKQVEGFEVAMFDYEHETYTPGKHYDFRNRMRSIQTVVMFSFEESRIPSFELHPGNSQLSINPEFDRYIKQHPMIDIESNGSTLIVYEGEILHPADELDFVLKEAFRVLELIKAQ